MSAASACPVGGAYSIQHCMSSSLPTRVTSSAPTCVTGFSARTRVTASLRASVSASPLVTESLPVSAGQATPTFCNVFSVLPTFVAFTVYTATFPPTVICEVNSLHNISNVSQELGNLGSAVVEDRTSPVVLEPEFVVRTVSSASPKRSVFEVPS